MVINFLSLKDSMTLPQKRLGKLEGTPEPRLGERLESECQPEAHPEGSRELLTAFKEQRTFCFKRSPLVI